MKPTRALGIDMVEVDRIRAIHRRRGQRFLDRMLTRSEQSYCLTKGDPYPSIAARIAAKEAVSKAFGFGIGNALRWVSVSVDILPTGAPVIVLDEQGKKLLKKSKAKEVLVSLTHSREHAIAVATLC